LYQGSSLGGAALDAYLRELNAGLAPAVGSALRDRMTQLASEPDKLYEYLKVYLMLGLPEKLTPGEPQFVTEREWQQRFPNDPTTLERLQ
ncbi:ImcF-related family protein, partial [Enterococcus faecium]|uniref:ImcF-related family protein n=1 Tax=Enterococcus faecium TaxID=1352 RepID=UPI003F420A95